MIFLIFHLMRMKMMFNLCFYVYFGLLFDFEYDSKMTILRAKIDLLFDLIQLFQKKLFELYVIFIN
jgi:hypothetical protein